jgi:Flp pilus assembly pilin Flp
LKLLKKLENLIPDAMRQLKGKSMISILKDEGGATLVEYVLLVALVGVLAIVALRALGGTASNKLRFVGNTVS